MITAVTLRLMLVVLPPRGKVLKFAYITPEISSIKRQAAYVYLYVFNGQSSYAILITQWK